MTDKVQFTVQIPIVTCRLCGKRGSTLDMNRIMYAVGDYCMSCTPGVVALADMHVSRQRARMLSELRFSPYELYDPQAIPEGEKP